jgi:transposase
MTPPGQMSGHHETARQQSRAAWGAVASGWYAQREEFWKASRPVSEWMVRKLDPQPGDTVLELAAGLGDTGCIAARLVGESVELAYVDQGYSGEAADAQAQAHGIQLEVLKYPEARRGFVLLPRRWVVERDFAWASRFRRLVKDYERLPQTVAGLHIVAFACLFLHRAIAVLGSSP